MSNHGYGRTEIDERFDAGALNEDVLILGVFDFPDRAPAGQAGVPVPELVVRRVLARTGPATARPIA
jgi:hypothetical protein